MSLVTLQILTWPIPASNSVPGVLTPLLLAVGPLLFFSLFSSCQLMRSTAPMNDSPSTPIPLYNSLIIFLKAKDTLEQYFLSCNVPVTPLGLLRKHVRLE